MKKFILIIGLFSLKQAVKAQQADPASQMVTSQSFRKFMVELQAKPVAMRILKYKENYYRLDSNGLKNLNLTWIDSTYFFKPSALPTKINRLNTLVLVMHLNDRNHPNAFDSLKTYVTLIKGPKK